MRSSQVLSEAFNKEGVRTGIISYEIGPYAADPT